MQSANTMKSVGDGGDANARPPAARSLTYTRAELAGLFNLRPATISNKLPELEMKGFPRRLPGLAVWSRAAVDAWIAANGAPAAPHGDPERIEIARAVAALDQGV